MLWQLICDILLFHMYISYLYILLWWHLFNYSTLLLYDKFYIQKAPPGMDLWECAINCIELNSMACPQLMLTVWNCMFNSQSGCIKTLRVVKSLVLVTMNTSVSLWIYGFMCICTCIYLECFDCCFTKI